MTDLLKRGKAGTRALNRLFNASAGLGANGAVATEALGGMMKTTIRLSAVAFALTDTAGVVARSAKKIYDFPEGVINVYGAVASLTVGKSSAGVIDAWDGDFSLGSVAAAGDATLTGTEADILPSTATPQAVGGNTTAKGKSAVTPVQFDGTTTPLDLYLNLLVDDTDHDVTTTPANLVVSGTITILWALLGDY